MDILLINPIIRKSSPPAYFPLGLGYIAQVLSKEGHSVAILDANAHRWSSEVIEQKIRDSRFDLVGIGGLITEYKYIKWLVSVLKKHHPKKMILLGGGLATAVPKLILEKLDVDIIVVGEGEETVKELARVLINGGDLQKVKGIWYKENGSIHQTLPHELIQDLNCIPFPRWDLFPLDLYLTTPTLGFDTDSNIKTMNLITSRGCPYRCVYCYHDMWGYKFRARSADNIIEEIKFLRKQYGVRGISFTDDTFILDKKRVYELCDKLINQKIEVLWSCNGRVDLVNPDLLRRMRRAGCVAIAYGIESGSQKMLDAMRKQVTVEQAKKAIQWTREADIAPLTYMIIGMIGETEQTVQETIDFCRQTATFAEFSILTPIPGSEIYKRAEKARKIGEVEKLLEDWEEWQNKIVVNLTDMSDWELMNLKKKAEQEIYQALIAHSRGQTLRKTMRYYKKFGAKATFKKIYHRLKNPPTPLL